MTGYAYIGSQRAIRYHVLCMIPELMPSHAETDHVLLKTNLFYQYELLSDHWVYIVLQQFILVPRLRRI